MRLFGNLFQKKSESVEIDELKNWINANNHVSLRLKPEIRNVYETIRNAVSDLYNDLIALEKIDVSDTKVELRLKQLVQGNKSIYVKNVDSFLKKVVLPNEHDYESASKVCDEIKINLDDLNKRTGRNYQIVKNLIGKELETVVSNLRKVAASISGLKMQLERHNSDWIKYRELENKIDNLLAKIKEEKDGKIKLMKRDEEIKQFKEEQKRTKVKLKKLQGSKEVIKLRKDREKLEKVEREINQKSDDISNLFSGLVKAFKKYDNEHNSKIFEEYVVDCIGALSEDKEIKVFENLNLIRKDLEDRKLDLRDDKFERALNSIKKIKKTNLEELRSNFCQLKRDKEELREAIKENKIEEELDDLSKELRKVADKIYELENYEVAAFDFEKAVEDIEREVKSLTRINLEIKHGSLD